MIVFRVAPKDQQIMVNDCRLAADWSFSPFSFFIYRTSRWLRCVRWVSLEITSDFPPENCGDLW